MRPLRVALDATPLLGRPTGVGQFCRGLLGALAEQPDIAPSAFAVSWRRRRGIEGLLPAGVPARQRAMPARPLHAAWRHGERPPIEWFVGSQDVVHGTNFVVPPSRRAVRVVTVHDLTTVRFPALCDGPTLAYPALIRRALDHGAWVHTPSAFVAAEVVQAFDADPARVRAVHSGIPARAPADPGARERLVPPTVRRYVLSIGTAEPRKDLPGLVRAFDLVAPEHPDLGLVLAGPPGWGAADVDRAVSASPHRSRIVRTGWLDDASVSALLEGASVLAFPSIYEGFGFPPLQAMAAGVPVVASRAGALPEVLGTAAELVEVGDVEGLAKALDAVLVDDERRRRLVEMGLARATEFGWDRCGRGLAEIYAAALAAAEQR